MLTRTCEICKANGTEQTLLRVRSPTAASDIQVRFELTEEQWLPTWRRDF